MKEIHDMTMITLAVKAAEPHQLQEVKELYYAIIDAVGDATDSVGWKKDIYPAPEFLKASIESGELFIAMDGSRIVGAMVLNHEGNDSYGDFTWPTEAERNEVTVIHALGIHPEYTGRGCARQMVEYAIDHARRDEQKVIRLDVLKGNSRAEKLYSGMGFRYLHTIQMYYEDTGWTDFELYEYPL